MPKSTQEKPTVGLADRVRHRKERLIQTSDECRPDQVADASPRCVSCELQEGVPKVAEHVWGYYLSRQNGKRMLIFDRALGECICINGAIDVVILRIDGGQVRLGVSAPCNVSIRDESPCE